MDREKTLLKRISVLENKLLQQSKEISLLSEFSLFLTAADIQKTCDLVAYRVGILTNAKFIRLYLLNDEGKLLRIVSGYNISDKYLEMLKDSYGFSVETTPPGITVKNKTPFIVNDVNKDDRFANWREISQSYGYLSYVAVPLLCTDRVLGVIDIFFEKANIFTDALLAMITTIANIGALAIENALFVSKFRELSTVDELTSLYNYRFLMNTLQNEIEKSARYNHPLSYIMIDIDNFKTINDTFGHLKGDEVLKTIADGLKNNLRKTDYACRYGGDEFAIILPVTGKEAATKVVQNIREVCTDMKEILFVEFGASIGVATYPDDGLTVSELINLADNFIYQEKKSKVR
ncbi:MAG: sensor domain-containing diguanylate cyclase [Nitrospirota bacterium]|nr:sensor domain-containing diguanylate cyclase [Nitrospirota bacterium]